MEVTQVKKQDFPTERVRKTLTEAFVNLTERCWKLSRNEQARLLGWNYKNKRTTMDAMRAGRTILDNDEDKIERVIDLVNIHKSLRILFPDPSSRRRIYEWVKVKRERFGNHSALDIMLAHGKIGIHAIRRYLDHERTR